MKLQKIFLTIIYLIISTLVVAQKPMIEVINDKKRINVHELGFPESTPIINVLSIFPELLSRPGAWYINDYAIEVNDVEIGDTRDAVLSQLCIADVKFIEISENPITSYTNNGQGGTISIELIDLEEDKVTGNASLAFQYPLDISPLLNIGYKKDKFTVRGLAIYEFYNPKNIKETINDETVSESYSKLTENVFNTEMVRVYLSYNPSKNDQLKLCISEDWTKDITKSTVETTLYDNSVNIGKNNNTEVLSNILGRFEYNHYFCNKSRLRFQTTYKYTPTKSYITKPTFNMGDTVLTHNVAGKLEYLLPLVKQEVTKKAELKFGVNFNLNFSNEKYKYETELLALPFVNKSLNTYYSTTYISPYLQAEYINNNLSFKAIFDYQYFKYNIKNSGYQENITPQNNLTGKLMAGWMFAPNQKLRLIFDRKLKRPTSAQVFPYLVFSPQYNNYVLGNTNLKPILSHEITIDYITETDNENYSVILNMGTSIIFVDNVIKQQVESFSSDLFRLTNDYTTFINEGSNRIMKTNFMFYYKRKVFSLLATANVFNNVGNKSAKTSEHYTYYNAMICPTFNFQKGWSFYVSLTYNSKIKKTNEKLGNVIFSNLSVSKSFGQFTVYAYGQIALKNRTVNATFAETGKITTTYNAINNYAGIGLKYQF